MVIVTTYGTSLYQNLRSLIEKIVYYREKREDRFTEELISHGPRKREDRLFHVQAFLCHMGPEVSEGMQGYGL